MAHIILKQNAIELRKQGKTYREIRMELNVAKSSLSDWLRKYPLTEAELSLLAASREKGRFLQIEKTRITKQKKREDRLRNVYDLQQKKLAPLSKRELEIAGLFLYWGEGYKSLRGPVGISNSNPKVIQFSIYWLSHIYNVPLEKIRIRLQLYKDMNTDKEIEFWMKQLTLPKSNFRNPYYKNSLLSNLTYKKGFGHGTCDIFVNDRALLEKILMGTEAIADFYCSRI